VDDRRQDLLALLMPITRHLRRIEEAAAARHGMTMWQYAILSVVEDRPDRNQADVADGLGYSRNRIIADLDELERAGLLTRTRAADRRANVLAVTARGRTAAAAVRAEIHRDEDLLMATMSATGRHSFLRGVRSLYDAVRTSRRPPETARSR
jgi:DNA-binding MarR family transcriptional regulator